MTEPKNYFINPCCFGEDVAEWLINELRKLGMKTDEKPGREDFGWYLDFELTGIGHTFVVGYRPATETEAGTWVGWLERKHGFVGSLLGWRKRGIQSSAVEAIHHILICSPQIQDVRWHYSHDFDKGDEDRGAPSPQSLALKG